MVLMAFLEVFSFAVYVLNGHKRVAEYHPRSTVGHDFLDFLPHGRSIALGGAGVAGSAVLMGAASCSLQGVVDSLCAFGAEFFSLSANVVMATAKYSCHGHHSFLVLFQSFLLRGAKNGVRHITSAIHRCA